MDLGIKGRVALVTGGASGIGAAICETLAAEGVRIVVADMNGEGAQAKAEQLRQAGAESLAQTVDVSDEQSVQRMYAEIGQAFGSVDILVNNAGFTRDMRITKMSVADWDSVVDVILKGAFLCTREAVPYFSRQSWGRVINISSRAHLGNPGQANYSSAKAGIIGFTRAMALELGRHSVTVNAVAPGIINTAAVLNLPHYPKIQEAAEKTTPLGRIGTPPDVAGAVAFLASEQAAYITGDVLHVTGGRY